MKKFSHPEYPFRSNFLNLNGHNMHYVDEGRGTPILMLHGNPTWSFYYRHLINHFKTHYRMVAPDHIGCGLSDKPQDWSYTLDAHIQNVESLIKFLDLKDITLVVHDWGGAIGMGLATRNPERFSRLVILNTAAFPSPSIPTRIALCRAGKLGEFLVRRFNLFAWPATFMASEKKLTDSVKAAYLAPYDSYENRIAVARFVQDIPMETGHQTYPVLSHIAQQLPNLNLPTCIVWGGKDFCFHREFFEQWLKFIPEAEAHWLAKAGHYVLEDAAKETVSIMERFIHS